MKFTCERDTLTVDLVMNSTHDMEKKKVVLVLCNGTVNISFDNLMIYVGSYEKDKEAYNLKCSKLFINCNDEYVITIKLIHEIMSLTYSWVPSGINIKYIGSDIGKLMNENILVATAGICCLMAVTGTIIFKLMNK